MSATHVNHSSNGQERLYLAFDLGWIKWRLAFTTGLGHKTQQRTIAARDLAALGSELERVKRHFSLGAEPPASGPPAAGPALRPRPSRHRFRLTNHQSSLHPR